MKDSYHDAMGIVHSLIRRRREEEGSHDCLLLPADCHDELVVTSQSVQLRRMSKEGQTCSERGREKSEGSANVREGQSIRCIDLILEKKRPQKACPIDQKGLEETRRGIAERGGLRK